LAQLIGGDQPPQIISDRRREAVERIEDPTPDRWVESLQIAPSHRGDSFELIAAWI
jgi:hypothetical protein